MTKIHKDIIPYKKGWLVVDKEAKPIHNEYYIANFTHILQYGEGQPLLGITAYKIIASIGIRIEEVPLIELPDGIKGKQILELWRPERDSKRLNTKDFDIWSKGIIVGYKANTKQYTEADMRNIIAEFLKAGCPNYPKDERGFWLKWVDTYLKSLQKAPISVELEMEKYQSNEGHLTDYYSLRPKITSPETNTIIPINIEYEK